ncbi:MAG: hypothetical protein KIT31_08075 [Deltaproteobacteria bacterium]|nr:hypothetical protein [Deltaproteobacteria bacterium]
MQLHHVCVAAIVCVTTTAVDGEPPRSGGGAAATLAQMRERDPSLQAFLDGASGYIVVPEGAARGVLYLRGRPSGVVAVNRPLGAELVALYSDFGVARLREHGTYELEASAEPVVLAPGAAKNTKYIDGVAVFTLRAVPSARVRGQALSLTN